MTTETTGTLKLAPPTTVLHNTAEQDVDNIQICPILRKRGLLATKYQILVKLLHNVFMVHSMDHLPMTQRGKPITFEKRIPK